MKNIAHAVVLISGALLIVVGIAAACFQLAGEMSYGGLTPPDIREPGARSGETPQFTFSTHYVGVELAFIGASMELIAFLGSAFSRRAPNSN